jgi:hypothetical protein
MKKGIAELCLPNREAYLRNASRFQAVFKQKLTDFWQGNLLGFDVLKFDLFISPEPHESTKEAILRKYGEEGMKVINDLLHHPK